MRHFTAAILMCLLATACWGRGEDAPIQPTQSNRPLPDAAQQIFTADPELDGGTGDSGLEADAASDAVEVPPPFVDIQPTDEPDASVGC